MAIPLLQLDDRQFTDLVDELRALIPRYSKTWTDYNVSDPGIMLTELFAWLTETLLYRINRVPEASRIRLLALLGAVFQPATPAIIQLTVTDEDLAAPYILPSGTQIQARPTPSSDFVVFETMADVKLAPEAPVQTVFARQTVFVSKKQQIGTGNGEAHQIFEVPQPYLALPPAPLPQRPKVWVNQELWEYQTTLSDSKPDDHHFTVKPWLNAIVFGNGAADMAGTHGMIPPTGAKITAAYRFAPNAAGVVHRETLGVSKGKPWQLFRLAQPLLALDLQPFADLLPVVFVGEQRWDYRANYLEMEAEELAYTVEPWRNALRFGDGAHGKKPGAGDPIEINYHATHGATGNVPLGTTFAFNRRETGRAHLRVEDRFVTISQGRNPTGSNDVDEQIFELLHAQWRAITSTDVETVVRTNFQEIAQAYCLPGYTLDAKAPEANQPGQMGVILAPQPTAQWRADLPRLQEILGLTPNGQRLVARDQEGVVHVWDTQRGEKLATLGSTLRDLAFSPDGRQIAVVGDDQRLQLWTRESQKEEAVFVHPAAVNRVAFDAQGQYLATACADNLVRVWRTTPMQAEPAFAFQHTAPVSALAFHPDAAHLVSASLDGVARIWNLNTQQPAGLLPCPDHQAAIFAIAFSPDGRCLATAGLDRTVFLWAWPALKLIGTFPHPAAVLDVAFHPHQRQLVAACRNGTAQLWDIESGTLVSLFQHAGPVNAVAIDPTGQYLATASADRTVGLWDLNNAQKVGAIEHNAAVNAVDFYDAQSLATACDDAGVRVWNLQDMVNPLCKNLFLTAVQTVNFSPDGRRLITITDKQTASLWDTETGAAIANIATENPVNKVVFSADSQRLATAHAQQGVHVWDAQQGNLLALLPADAAGAEIVDLVFRPDNQQLATVDAQHKIRLWHLIRPPQLVDRHQAPQTAEPVLVLPFTTVISDLRFNQDGTRLAVRLADNGAQLWSTRKPAEAAGKLIADLGSDVSAIAFSPDGQRLATVHETKYATEDDPPQVKQQVRLWSTKRGVPEGGLLCDIPVSGLIFSPSNQRLLTIRAAEPESCTLQFWDLRLKNVSRPLRSEPLPGGKMLLLNATGQWLALVTERLLSIWDIEQGQQISTLYIDFTDPQVQADPWLLHYWDPKDNSHQVLPISSQASASATRLGFTQGKFLLATSGDPQSTEPRAQRPTTNGLSALANGNGQVVSSDTHTVTARAFEVWNAEHVYDVDHLLNERRLLTTQSHVAGPRYTSVTLTIQIVRKTTAKSITRLQTDVTNALLQFFHPLSGGPDGKGWPPGRDIYRSEVYQVIEGVAGVDHVESLKFDPPDEKGHVVIPPYQGVNAIIHLEISDATVSQLWPLPRSNALWLPQRQAVI